MISFTPVFSTKSKIPSLLKPTYESELKINDISFHCQANRIFSLTKPKQRMLPSY